MMPDPKTLLPLTPAVFHILLALAGDERHGYGIMQEVTALTDSESRIGPGTLYGTLKRIVAAGLVEECGDRPVPYFEDERRRYYRLTEWGRVVAEEEAKRLEILVNAARAKQFLKP